MESGVRPHVIETAWFWSDSLAETRNAIHFGVEPAIAYTFEGVGLFLIGASTHLKDLYRIKEAAEAMGT